MSSRRAPALGARFVGVLCLGWLALTTGYGAAAAAPGIDLGGAPLPKAASTDKASPTALAPGLWRATLAPDLPQYFSYQRRINGSRLHIGVLGAPQGDSSDSIKVTTGIARKDSSDLASCGEETQSTESRLPRALIGAGVVVGGGTGSSAEACRAAETVRIQVDRGYSSAPTDLPYVLKVVEEAPADTDDSEPDDKPSYTVPSPGEERDEPGGTSFADAPRLDARSGEITVETTITEGAELLWRVPLTWGDHPVVRVDVADAEGADAETFASSGPSLIERLIDPIRDLRGYVDSDSDDSSSGSYRAAGDDGPTVLVVAGVPVRQVDGRVPGDHWVSLAASPAPEDRKAVEIPVKVTVAVDPGDEDDAPSYDGVLVSPDKATSLEKYTPDRPFLVGEDTFAAVASGSPESGDGWLTGQRWAGIGLGVASLACLGAGVVRIRSTTAARRSGR